MNIFLKHLPQWLWAAGIVQLALALGSIAIPFLLRWKEEMAKVNGLIRSIFYTYSVYIFATNIWFGLISVCIPRQLAGASPLALATTIFIALYWWGRVAVQFRFGRAPGRPAGLFFTLGEIVLWLLFLALAAVYTLAACHNAGAL